MREHRELRSAAWLPPGVRDESAAMASVLCTIEQRLDAPWHHWTMMMDASDLGGGIVKADSDFGPAAWKTSYNIMQAQQ